MRSILSPMRLSRVVLPLAILCGLLGLFTCLATVAQTVAASPDETVIRQLAAQSLGSWDKADAAGIAAYWAEDGDLVDVSGNETGGRSQIEQRFADMLLGADKGTHLAFQVWSVHFLKPDVAIVDGYFEIENRLDASGRLLPAEKVLFTDFLSKTNGKWEAEGRREAGVSQFPKRFLITRQP
jgi:uncharacterized protein (TIGR02246 family)